MRINSGRVCRVENVLHWVVLVVLISFASAHQHGPQAATVFCIACVVLLYTMFLGTTSRLFFREIPLRARLSCGVCV